MADIIESIYTINGVRGKLRIPKNGDTATFIDASSGTTLASLQPGGEWEPTPSFAFAHNRANRSSWFDFNNLSPDDPDEFKDQFFYNGPTTQNKDGKWVSKNSINYQLKAATDGEIGAISNYDDNEERIETNATLYENNVYGATDGEGNKVNSAGERVQTNNPEQFADAEAVVKPATEVKEDTSKDASEDTSEGASGNVGWRSQKGKNETYSYPFKQAAPKGLLDYIQFEIYDYNPPGLDVIGGDYGGSRKKGEKYETIQLPMVPSLSESNSTDWGGDSLNALKGPAAKLATGLIGGIGNWSLDQATAAFGTLGSNIDEAIKDPNLKNFIISHFAGQAVGANIMGRNAGMVVNNNLELLFSGPRLRTFNFNFRFTPREDDEAKVIRKIIKIFKRSMAPQRSTSNLFLKTPRVFDLKYIKGTDGDPHPWMNKFKTCALSAFNVDYTPDGSYMTYQDGSMTAYNVTMTFNELEPNYADQYNDNDSETTGW